MKILVVEDDAIVRTNLVMHLRNDLGHEVVEAGHALDAIEKLMPGAKLDKTFDIIITDMRMRRDQSGLWFCQYLDRSRVRLRCLLRSSEATYRDHGEEFELKDVEKAFDFVKFRIKDNHFKDVDEFLTVVN